MQEQQVITAEMAIGEVIDKYPDTIHIFVKHGLGCVGCAVARFENIRRGAVAHGVDVDLLMKDLNDTVMVAQDN
jgi:hybrid cluster-associated redox disulfide protein